MNSPVEKDRWHLQSCTGAKDPAIKMIIDMDLRLIRILGFNPATKIISMDLRRYAKKPD